LASGTLVYPTSRGPRKVVGDLQRFSHSGPAMVAAGGRTPWLRLHGFGPPRHGSQGLAARSPVTVRAGGARDGPRRWTAGPSIRDEVAESHVARANAPGPILDQGRNRCWRSKRAARAPRASAQHRQGRALLRARRSGPRSGRAARRPRPQLGVGELRPAHSARAPARRVSSEAARRGGALPARGGPTATERTRPVGRHTPRPRCEEGRPGGSCGAKDPRHRQRGKGGPAGPRGRVVRARMRTAAFRAATPLGPCTVLDARAGGRNAHDWRWRGSRRSPADDHVGCCSIETDAVLRGDEHALWSR